MLGTQAICPAAAARYAPHHHKWYKPYDNHLRIYEQTAANLPCRRRSKRPSVPSEDGAASAASLDPRKACGSAAPPQRRLSLVEARRGPSTPPQAAPKAEAKS